MYYVHRPKKGGAILAKISYTARLRHFATDADIKVVPTAFFLDMIEEKLKELT